jgi:WD40 repeat protein
MSARCQTLAFLACFILLAAEPSITTAKDKSSSAAGVEKRLPARSFVRLGTPRFQQERGVSVVAFAPDGKTLAVQDVLWDVSSGKKLRALQMPAPDGLSYTPIYKLTFAPDGKVLAGQCFHCVRLWQTATGKKLRKLSCPDGTSFYALAFSPDGKQLATSLWDEKNKASPILVWDTATGREVRRLAGRETPAQQLAFSADGQKLTSLHFNAALPCNVPQTADPGSIVLWDVACGKQIFAQGKIRPGVLSHDGRLYTRQGAGGRIEIHDLDKRRLLRALDSDDVWHVFSPDGKVLACADKRNILHLWDVATGRLLKQMSGRCEEIHGRTTTYFPFAFSSDGKLLATGSLDDGNRAGPVCLWDVAKGEELLPAEDHFAGVTCVTFAADGKTLASGSVDRTLHLWDTASGRHLRRFMGPEDTIQTVALSPTGRLLASSGRDNMLRLWETRTGRERHCFAAPANEPLSLSFLEDGKTLQWWGWIGNIRRYDTASGKMIRTLRSRKDVFYSAPLGLDGLSAPSTFAGGEDSAWPDDLLPPESRNKRQNEEKSAEERFGNPRHIRVSVDGRMAATVETVCLGGLGGSKCRIRVWEMASGGLIADLGETNGSSCLLVFSRDGWGLISAGESNGSFAKFPLQAWDLIAGKPVKRLQAPLSPFLCLAVSPDGTKLAAGHDDAAVRLWNIAGLFQPPAASPLSSAGFQRQANRLSEIDAAAAYRAMYRLARCPEQSLPFLRERFAPVNPQVRRFITDLDNEQFAVREKASKALERLGRIAEADLRRARANPPTLEVRLRIDRLLEKLADPTQRKRAALEVLRGISVLERIGTPKACAVLRDLTTAACDRDARREAEAALRRLELQPLRPSGRE